MRFRQSHFNFSVNLALIFATLLFVFVNCAPAYAVQTNTITFKINSTEYLVNGKSQYMEVAPFVQNNRTFLPVRYVAESLGVASGNISYTNGTVTIIKGDKTIKLNINSPILSINGVSTTMDVSAILVNGRTMLPIRWIGEALGTEVNWNQTAKSVSISYSNQTLAVSTTEELPGLTYPKLSSKEKLLKSYEWKYDDTTYKWNVEIPKNLYDYDSDIYSFAEAFQNYTLATKNRVLRGISNAETKDMILSLYSGGNYTPWVEETSNDSYIKQIAKWLANQAKADGYSYLQTAEFAQSFVGGALPYTVFEIPELPVQTLVDNGDCKGKSILLACILKNMGYKVALLDFAPLPGSKIGHIAVGLALSGSKAPANTNYDCYFYEYDGTDYYYTETTSPGFHIGEYGDLSDITIDLKSANVYPVN
jgi:hypothetical protein